MMKTTLSEIKNYTEWIELQTGYCEKKTFKEL